LPLGQITTFLSRQNFCLQKESMCNVIYA